MCAYSTPDVSDLRGVNRTKITIDLLKDLMKKLFQSKVNEIERINWFSKAITDM